MLQRLTPDVVASCFGALRIEVDSYMSSGVYLSLMSMDISFLGQLSQQHDLDALWDKLDKNKSGYIEREELELLLYTWIREELKSQGEPVPRSRNQIAGLLKRMTDNVLNYCDVDKDNRLSKEELSRFVDYLQSMKRLDSNQADVATKLLDNLPLNPNMKSVLAHSDSVMPNDLCVRVQSIIDDLNNELEQQSQAQQDQRR